MAAYGDRGWLVLRINLPTGTSGAVDELHFPNCRKAPGGPMLLLAHMQTRERSVWECKSPTYTIRRHRAQQSLHMAVRVVSGGLAEVFLPSFSGQCPPHSLRPPTCGRGEYRG